MRANEAGILEFRSGLAEYIVSDTGGRQTVGGSFDCEPADTVLADLKILEQRWGMALQSAGFGVWDLDPRREQVHYSPEWKSLLGYGDSNEPDSTATWRGRVHPDDLQPMTEALFAHLEGRHPVYEKNSGCARPTAPTAGYCHAAAFSSVTTRVRRCA